MSGDIWGKFDGINFVDSPAVSMNNFHEYHDQMLEINKDEVMRVRDNSTRTWDYLDTYKPRRTVGIDS